MSLKLCANLSWLFSEATSLPDRYALAARAGFRAVECAFPYDYEPERLARAREDARLEHVLLNAFPGETMGVAALAEEEEDFLGDLRRSLHYCKQLKCKR